MKAHVVRGKPRSTRRRGGRGQRWRSTTRTGARGLRSGARGHRLDDMCAAARRGELAYRQGADDRHERPDHSRLFDVDEALHRHRVRVELCDAPRVNSARERRRRGCARGKELEGLEGLTGRWSATCSRCDLRKGNVQRVTSAISRGWSYKNLHSERETMCMCSSLSRTT